MPFRNNIRIVLFWATFLAGSAIADTGLTDDQLVAGWEETQLHAVKEAIRELSSYSENQNYNALSLERRLVNHSDDPPYERYYRKCVLVRHSDGVTWIRYLNELNSRTGDLVRIQRELIIDGERILQVGRLGSSSTARFVTEQTGDLWAELESMKLRVIQPNRLTSVNSTMRRPDVRYRINENGVPRVEVGMLRPRQRPGDTSRVPPTPGGDIRMLLSGETPHLPTLSRRFMAHDDWERFKESFGTRFYYDRSPGKPVFLSRVVYQVTLKEGETGTLSADTRFERVKFDSPIPRIKIAETRHAWQMRKDTWTTVPVDDVPKDFADRVEVVSDVECGKRHQEFESELTLIRDRLEALPVPPITGLPPADGEIVEAESKPVIPAQSGTARERTMFLVFGIGLLVAGFSFFVVFGAARLAKP